MLFWKHNADNLFLHWIIPDADECLESMDQLQVHHTNFTSCNAHAQCHLYSAQFKNGSAVSIHVWQGSILETATAGESVVPVKDWTIN